MYFLRKNTLIGEINGNFGRNDERKMFSADFCLIVQIGIFHFNFLNNELLIFLANMKIIGNFFRKKGKTSNLTGFRLHGPHKLGAFQLFLRKNSLLQLLNSS